MENSARHRKIWRLLYVLTNRWICRKFSLEHEDIHVAGPMLLIPNHTCAWDPLLTAMSLPKKQVYFVASEHLFRMGLLSRMIEWLVAPIPRRKAGNGMDTVKACLRHLKAGNSVCLFAEGEQCWTGRNNPIFPATGKLAKTSGATLVTFRLEGAYLSRPRWAKSIRRGRVHGHPVGVYPPEVLRRMSAGEVNAAIEKDLQEDAWERQRKSPVPFRGKRLAEGLERALWLCPSCRRVGTLRTENDTLSCTCGLCVKVLNTGFLSPPEPFETIADWDDWQREALRNRQFQRESREILFSDNGVRLLRIGPGHREHRLPGGRLVQTDRALLCGKMRFPLRDIRNMADVLADRLLFSVGDTYYELQSDGRCSMRKYLEFWKER